MRPKDRRDTRPRSSGPARIQTEVGWTLAASPPVGIDDCCQALATRTAKKILVNEFGGVVFVSGGSPTVSTDASVTAAPGAVAL
jgi:hypothetical protein